MKSPRSKTGDRPKKSNIPNKVAPVRSRNEDRKAQPTHSGRVHRTPDGTIEENSEEAAP